MVTSILLADDNKSEHIFFAHSLRFIDPNIKLHSVSGGQALMTYLHDASVLPDILFLDVNMPVKNGKQCLSEIRANKRYDSMPIVMYSTSDAQSDTDETFRLGADLYVRKPVEIDDLVILLRSVLSVYQKQGIKHSSREHYVLTPPTAL